MKRLNYDRMACRAATNEEQRERNGNRDMHGMVRRMSIEEGLVVVLLARVAVRSRCAAEEVEFRPGSAETAQPLRLGLPTLSGWGLGHNSFSSRRLFVPLLAQAPKSKLPGCPEAQPSTRPFYSCCPRLLATVVQCLSRALDTEQGRNSTPIRPVVYAEPHATNPSAPLIPTWSCTVSSWCHRKQ